MNKILLGFDGSEGSEQALNRALMLLDEYGELIILAVIPSPSDKAFVDEDMYKKLKIKAHSMIDNVIRDIGEHGFTITGMVEEGDHWMSDAVFGAALGWAVGHSVAGRYMDMEIAGFELMPMTPTLTNEPVAGLALMKQF